MGPGNRHRWTHLATGSGGLITGRLVVAVCGLVQVPIALASLGQQAFGVWLALCGILWSLGFLDFGIGSAAQNRISRLLAVERPGEAVALVRRLGLILTLEALLVAVLALPLVVWGRWDHWLGIDDPAVTTHLAAALAILFAATAVNLPLSLANRVAAAEQRMWISGLATAVSAVLGVGGVALAARLHGGLAWFVLASCILPVGPNVLVSALYCLRPGWLRTPRSAHADVNGLLREGLLFVPPQIGGAFIGNFVPTLVALYAGPLAAGTFGVLQRFYGLALNLQGMALAPAWPAFAHAGAVKDARYARRTFRLMALLTALAFVLPILALTPAVPWALHLWLGRHAPPVPGLLLWSLALWTVLQCCGTPLGVFLNGIGRPHSLAVLAPVTTLLSLALCHLNHAAAGNSGAIGVVAALALPYAFLTLPVTAWCSRKALSNL